MTTQRKKPYRKLIIKFYRSQTSDQVPHDHSEKSRKLSSSQPMFQKANSAEMQEIQRIIAKEKSIDVARGSRTVSKVCQLKNKKGYYAVAIWVEPQNLSSSLVDVDSRTSRKGYEECKLKNKRENVHEKCNKREKKLKMQHAMMMDCSRKMQCWAMLKHLMVEKDVLALKELVVHRNYESITKPKLLSLEDIESKLKKQGYSEVDEFVHDIKLVFSYVLLGYPPKSDIHKTSRRVTDGFEINWKTLKKKWMCEERDR